MKALLPNKVYDSHESDLTIQYSVSSQWYNMSVEEKM